MNVLILIAGFALGLLIVAITMIVLSYFVEDKPHERK